MNTLLCLALVGAMVLLAVDAQPPWLRGRGRRPGGAGGAGGAGGQGGQTGAENPSDPANPAAPGGPGGRGGRPGRGGRGRGGRFGARRDLAIADAERSRWNRTVDGTDIAQGGFSSQTENKVMVGTFGRDLDTVGLSRGGTLYDFNGPSPVAAIRTRRRCYLITFPAGQTLASLAGELASRDGTTVTTALTEEQLTAVGGRLTDEERQTLVDGNPSLARFCFFADIFQTSAADAATFPVPGAEPEGQQVTSFLTLDSKVSILEDTPAEGPGGPGGPGRPGRPGRGRFGRQG